MTVGQLIAELQKHPTYMVAVVNMDCNEFANGGVVRLVESAAAIRRGDYPDLWGDLTLHPPSQDGTDDQPREQATVVNITS